MARLVSYGLAGVDPKIMASGRYQHENRTDKAGLKVSDMDVIEANEAFGCRPIAVVWISSSTRKNPIPTAGQRTRPSSFGAHGALLTVKALYELERIGGKNGAVTMCIGGGQGVAAVYGAHALDAERREARRVRR